MVLVLALNRLKQHSLKIHRGSPLQDVRGAQAQSEVGLNEQIYTCAKFGCLDVRTKYTACQCSQHCLKEGGCCPDYKSMCTPERAKEEVGDWPACPAGQAVLPGVWKYADDGRPLRLKVLSYNVEWWRVVEQLGGNGNSAARLIGTNMDPAFDLIGFQEFYDPWYGLTRPGYSGDALLKQYQFIRGALGGPVGSVIGYKRDSFTLLARGQDYVAEDKKGPGTTYYGKRGALWVRLQHIDTQKVVFFMNHHGPLPLHSGGVCGGKTTAANLLQLIVTNAQRSDVIILVGDFNAGTQSTTIRALATRLTKAYAGNAYGGIDNIFTNLPRSSVSSAQDLGSGGSDHAAIMAVLEASADTMAVLKASASTWQKAATSVSTEVPANEFSTPQVGSCATYGCHSSYRPEHDCQCNAACSQHNNCCNDYSDCG